MFRLLCALGVFVAGSAAPLAQSSLHPAHADAPAAPVALVTSPLAPAPPADVPAVLRPTASASHTTGHAHTAHSALPRQMDVVPAGLAETLDAYLALHDALASDRLDGVSAAAGALTEAFRPLTEATPAGDPHFWHMRSTETAAVLENAEALAAATTLQDARVAFGRLSTPLVALVDAMGTPDGYDLAVHRCGMAADVPEGGVWLQRAGDVRNPYFGSAMLTCGTNAESHGAHDHAHSMHTATLTVTDTGHACGMGNSGTEHAGCCAGMDCCNGGADCCDGERTCRPQTADHADPGHGSCCDSMAAGAHGSACAMGSHARTSPPSQGR